MKAGGSFHLGALVAGFCFWGVSARAQAPAHPDAPTLSEPFVFSLAPRRDDALSKFTASLQEHDELERAKELEAVNAPAASKLLDLLRYLPIQLGSGDGNEDFLKPNYLRLDFAKLPPDAHLFDSR